MGSTRTSWPGRVARGGRALRCSTGLCGVALRRCSSHECSAGSRTCARSSTPLTTRPGADRRGQRASRQQPGLQASRIAACEPSRRRTQNSGNCAGRCQASSAGATTPRRTRRSRTGARSGHAIAAANGGALRLHLLQRFGAPRHCASILGTLSPRATFFAGCRFRHRFWPSSVLLFHGLCGERWGRILQASGWCPDWFGDPRIPQLASLDTPPHKPLGTTETRRGGFSSAAPHPRDGRLGRKRVVLYYLTIQIFQDFKVYVVLQYFKYFKISRRRAS